MSKECPARIDRKTSPGASSARVVCATDCLLNNKLIRIQNSGENLTVPPERIRCPKYKVFKDIKID